MKKPKPPSIDELTKEQKKLLVSKENPERLKEITKKIDFFNWGIQ